MFSLVRCDALSNFYLFGRVYIVFVHPTATWRFILKKHTMTSFNTEIQPVTASCRKYSVMTVMRNFATNPHIYDFCKYTTENQRS